MSLGGEESFVEWLTKQMNLNGTLYLPHIARQYESNLQDVHPKLDVPITQNDEYEVFLVGLLLNLITFERYFGCS